MLDREGGGLARQEHAALAQLERWDKERDTWQGACVELEGSASAELSGGLPADCLSSGHSAATCQLLPRHSNAGSTTQAGEGVPELGGLGGADSCRLELPPELLSDIDCLTEAPNNLHMPPDFLDLFAPPPPPEAACRSFPQAAAWQAAPPRPQVLPQESPFSASSAQSTGTFALAPSGHWHDATRAGFAPGMSEWAPGGGGLLDVELGCLWAPPLGSPDLSRLGGRRASHSDALQPRAHSAAVGSLTAAGEDWAQPHGLVWATQAAVQQQQSQRQQQQQQQGAFPRAVSMPVGGAKAGEASIPLVKTAMKRPGRADSMRSSGELSGEASRERVVFGSTNPNTIRIVSGKGDFTFRPWKPQDATASGHCFRIRTNELGRPAPAPATPRSAKGTAPTSPVATRRRSLRAAAGDGDAAR